MRVTFSYCHRCGRPVAATARYCPRCGSPMRPGAEGQPDELINAAPRNLAMELAVAVGSFILVTLVAVVGLAAAATPGPGGELVVGIFSIAFLGSIYLYNKDRRSCVVGIAIGVLVCVVVGAVVLAI